MASLSAQLGAIAAGQISKQMQWQEGSWQQTALNAAVGAASTKLGGGSWEAAGVAAASPYANQAIKRLTTDSETGKTNLLTNTLAHAALSALEAKATGNNVTAGAVAGGGGELLAHSIAKFAYDVDGTNKTTAHLTETQKDNIKAISQLSAAVVGGVIGDSSQSAVNSAQIAQRAVENNFFDIILNNPQSDWVGAAEGEQARIEAEKFARERFAEEHPILHKTEQGIYYLGL